MQNYERYESRMFELNGNTKLLSIIGDPVEHSHSPQMHNFLSEKYKHNYVYTALRVHPDNLKDAICGIRAMGIAGVNVTAPHKFKVMQYLDEISPDAKKFGSVNTVVNKQGQLVGYNTDAEGFYQSLIYAGCDIAGKDILIIGAGGATQPIVILFAQKGAKSITIKNRTQKNADRLAEYVKSVTDYEIKTMPDAEKYDVVINTTSVGMHPDIDASPIDDYSFVDKNTFVADMIYNPEETLFLKNCRERGAKTVNGLGMLIFQGIIAYELFTGTKLPDDSFECIKKEVFGK